MPCSQGLCKCLCESVCVCELMGLHVLLARHCSHVGVFFKVFSCCQMGFVFNLCRQLCNWSTA